MKIFFHSDLATTTVSSVTRDMNGTTTVAINTSPTSQSSTNQNQTKGERRRTSMSMIHEEESKRERNIGSLFHLVLQLTQPKLCPNATWNTSAITFAADFYDFPLPLMINLQNKIAAASRNGTLIRIWINDSSNVSKTINTSNRYPISLFPSSDGEILVGYDTGYPYVDRWTLNGTLLSSILIYGQCYFLFVDINDHVYCAASNLNMVIRKPLNNQSNPTTVVAGTG